MSDSKITVLLEITLSAELRTLLEQALGRSAPTDAHPPFAPDDLTAARAAQALGSLEYLTREEAAAYTRRGLQAFDRDLRPRLTNRGTAAKHVYSREEIDACLKNETASLGRSDDSEEAGTSSSGSRTKASVTRNPRARTILRKLRGGRL